MSKRRKQKKVPFEELKKELIEKLSSTDNEVLVCRCYEIAFGELISHKSWDDENRRNKEVIRLIT
jgi:activator of 2-hydroxyglutaryl-CoA dehydratase|tara:strand:+ start:132 stop:326 length:195 start_codon:yes stop_codon:yes gene_type:complete